MNTGHTQPFYVDLSLNLCRRAENYQFFLYIGFKKHWLIFIYYIDHWWVNGSLLVRTSLLALLALIIQVEFEGGSLIVLVVLSANDLFYSRHLLRSLLSQLERSRPCTLKMSHAEVDSSTVIVIFYSRARTDKVLYFHFLLKARNIFSLGCTCECGGATCRQAGNETCMCKTAFFF